MNSQLKTSIICFVIAAGCLFFSAEYLAGIFAGALFKNVNRELVKAGFSGGRITFKEVKMRSFTHWDIHGLSVSMRCKGSSGMLSGRHFQFTAGSLSLKSANSKEKEWLIEMSQARIDFMDASYARIEESAWLDRGSASLALDFFSPAKLRRQIRFALSEIARLFSQGVTQIPVEASAVSFFKLKGRSLKARISIERQGTEYRLIMNPDDLRSLSSLLEEKMNDPEVMAVSRNPLKAPQLLQIRDYAALEARKKAAASSGFPEDAFRHILWSYLLTKEFGQETASEMTDAHEGGLNNPDLDRQMDLNNNRLGREYALSGVTEEKLALLAVNDPQVIRSPDGIDKANANASSFQDDLEAEDSPLEAGAGSLNIIETVEENKEGLINARV